MLLLFELVSAILLVGDDEQFIIVLGRCTGGDDEPVIILKHPFVVRKCK